MAHVKTQLFSLIGRTIVWKNLTNIPLMGVIVEKKPGKMCFAVKRGNDIFWLDRSEFTLPPLHRMDRQPKWLEDDSDGFVYKGVEGF
jgi:hypothetical protein